MWIWTCLILGALWAIGFEVLAFRSKSKRVHRAFEAIAIGGLVLALAFSTLAMPS